MLHMAVNKLLLLPMAEEISIEKMVHGFLKSEPDDWGGKRMLRASVRSKEKLMTKL